MNEKRYPVHLSAEHQQHLYQLIRTGKATAHQQMAARVLRHPPTKPMSNTCPAARSPKRWKSAHAP